MFWIIFAATYTAFALYFCLRLIYPLPIRPIGKCGLFLLALLPLTLRFVPDENIFVVPDIVLLIPTWIFLCIIIGASLALCTDILRLFLYVCRLRIPWRRCIPVVFVLTGSLVTYGMYEGLKVPSVTHITLAFPNLPGALDGKTIGVVADPQITRLFRGSWLREGLEKLMAERPDMIVVVGDAVDAPLPLLQEEAKAFQVLHAPMGVYFVPGNHEYYSDYGPWRKYFLSLPHMTVLENAHKTLPFGDDALHIIATTDPAAPHFGFEGPNMTKALAGLNKASGDNFRLLLTHRPFFEASAQENLDAQAHLHVAGHTHGGVILPIQNYIASRNGGYVSGLYESDFGTLFVSNGMGLWDGFPMRLGIPSEIPIITLRRAAK